MYAPMSVHYSIVIRRAALEERGIDISALLQIFEVGRPQGEADGVLTFGPHQGVEMSDNLSADLEALGLLYVDDYFVFAPEVPQWCRFGAALATDDDYN